MDARIVLGILKKVPPFLSLDGLIKLRHISKTWMYLFRVVSFKNVSDKILNKHNKVRAMFAFYRYLPPQGSQKWLDQRNGKYRDHLGVLLKQIYMINNPDKKFSDNIIPPTIGGSEITKVIKAKHFDQNFVKTKLDMGPRFDGNEYTRWGKLFEPVINEYTNMKFDTLLYEFGSIPGLRNVDNYPIQSYSPDGVSVVNTDRLLKVLGTYDTNVDLSEFKASATDETVVLFEFKCPATRMPENTVPAEYMAQPRVGACSLHIPEISVFGNVIFRKCALEDFGFNNNYDTEYHKKPVDGLSTIVCGFIGIYMKPSAPSNEWADEKDISSEPPLVTIPDLIIPDVTVLKKITKRLCGLVRNTIYNNKGSNHYLANYTNASLSDDDIPFLISAAYDHINILLMEEYGNYDVTLTDEDKIVLNMIYYFVPSIKAGCDAELAYKQRIILSVAKQCKLLRQRLQVYDINKIKYGEDAGKYPKAQFDNLTQNIFGRDSGYGIYYSEFYYQVTDPDKPLFEKYGSGVDTDLSAVDRLDKWLWQNLIKFEELSSGNAICIIPYKLMKIVYIPVPKEPDFIETHRAMIEKTIHIIQEVKKKDNAMDRLKAIIDFMPIEKRKTPSPEIEKPEEPAPIDLTYNATDMFNDEPNAVQF